MAKKSLKWFYNSAAWKSARAQALHRDMFTCAYCGARATEVHHIIELTEGNVHDAGISLSLGNLQSLCHQCHTQLTLVEHGLKALDCDMEYHFDADGHLVPLAPRGVRNETHWHRPGWTPFSD